MESKKSRSHPPRQGVRRKRKLIRKTFKRLVVLGTLGVGVKYLTDPKLGDVRRKKIMGLWGKS